MAEEDLDFERPFDVLDELKGKKIRILRKDESAVQGTLKAFDSHINMALTDVFVQYGADHDQNYRTDQFFQRGDSVVSVEKIGE